MNVDDVKAVVGDTPVMGLDKAREMTELITRHNLRDVLELGCDHGVSTCYMAAAVHQLGGGTVTTIDLESARDRSPSVLELVDKCGLGDLVTAYLDRESYTWRLMKMLEESAEPRFDLCYIDGAHTWEVDGFAFFLVDRLLRPGGWIVFDDIDWTQASSLTQQHLERIRRLSEEQRTTAQVRKVFELLVARTPWYTDLRISRGWGYARKTMDAHGAGGRVVRQDWRDRVKSHRSGRWLVERTRGVRHAVKR